MHVRTQLVLDALALLLAKASVIGLRLLTLYLCASSVSPAVFGPLAFALTIAEVSRFVADWGTDTWSLRRFSDPDKSSASGVFSWVLRQRTVMALLGVSLAWGCIGVLAPGLDACLRLLVALTAATSLWLNLGVNWLQAQASLRSVSALMAVAGCACAATVAALKAAGQGPDMMFGALLCFEILLALSVMWRASLQAGGRSRSPVPGQWRQWLKEGSPIAVASLITLTYGRLDQYYVSTYATPAIAGSYVLAQRLVEPLLFLAAAFSSTLYARASAVFMAAGRGEVVVSSFVARWMRWIALVAVGCAGLMGLAMHWGAPHWLPGYVGLTKFVWIALVCTVFRCINLGLTSFIQAQGAYALMLRLSLVNATVIVGGIFVLGQMLGALGAALAVCIGEALNAVIQGVILRRRLRCG